MTDLVTHRGPDAGATRQWAAAGLGFRRLALVDLEHGDQPATDERGRFWSVFNGEIYNHEELRADLRGRGHVLHGSGDADLVPHLYEQWGREMVYRLRGMFAIAVHDRETGELFLARDAFGIKPLYWMLRHGSLVFASEVKALRVTGWVAEEPDPQALWHYLSYGYVPDPATMWQGVNMLPAGHTLRFRDGKATVERWSQPDFRPDTDLRLDAAARDILGTLEQSVRAHLSADVPVGAYLSSGVDSSLLAAIAAKHQPLQTFSIGFHDSAEGFDELKAARDLAKTLGTVHHEQLVSGAEYWHNLPAIVASQEEPLADPSAPALWFLARQASDHVKAVLSGEGADELFGGYPIYQEPRALRPITCLPSTVRRRLGQVSDSWPDNRPGKGYLRRGSTDLAQRFLGNAPVFNQEAKAALWSGRPPGIASSDLLRELYDRTADHDDVTRMQLVSAHTWLPNSILMKADKMAMAHSLEVRVPYLDREVQAIAGRLPRRLRVRRGETKVALRAAAGLVLPAAIAGRPKLGFPIPFRQWLSGPIEQDVRGLLHDSDDPLLDRTALIGLLDQRGGPAQQRHLWSVMTYLIWRREQQQPVGAPGRTGAVTIHGGTVR